LINEVVSVVECVEVWVGKGKGDGGNELFRIPRETTRCRAAEVVPVKATAAFATRARWRVESDSSVNKLECEDNDGDAVNGNTGTTADWGTNNGNEVDDELFVSDMELGVIGEAVRLLTALLLVLLLLLLSLLMLPLVEFEDASTREAGWGVRGVGRVAAADEAPWEGVTKGARIAAAEGP